MAVARALTTHRRRTETRSRNLEQQIHNWLRRYARRVLDEEMRRGLQSIQKAAGDDEVKRLLDLVRMFGLRQIQEAGERAAGVTLSTSNTLVADYMASKTVLVQGIAAETRRGIRRNMRRVITGSLRETPVPSAGEIARRIRFQYYGPIEQEPLIVGSSRAALIARTELAQAENTGIVAGYEETGVERIEWLSYNDGRSGDRQHDEMNGEVVSIGELFETPLGNYLRYPGDPQAPIEETANCRCTVAPKRLAPQQGAKHAA